MDEENVGDGDLHHRLANGTSQANYQICADHVSVGHDSCLPNTAGKLYGVAENVEWAPAVFVSKGHEEDTADGKTSVAACRRRVESVNRHAEFFNHGAPGRVSDVEHDERPHDIGADDSIVDELAHRRPIEGIIWVRRRDGEQVDFGGGSVLESHCPGRPHVAGRELLGVAGRHGGSMARRLRSVLLSRESRGNKTRR